MKLLKELIILILEIGAGILLIAAFHVYISDTSVTGDIDDDGHVTAADSEMIKEYILNGTELDENIADVNADGIIDIKDYTEIRLHWLGKKLLD